MLRCCLSSSTFTLLFFLDEDFFHANHAYMKPGEKREQQNYGLPTLKCFCWFS